MKVSSGFVAVAVLCFSLLAIVSGSHGAENPPAQANESGEKASVPAAAPAAPAAQSAVDGATYAVRLRDLETRVDELKEQIRRSHTRLSLLSDTILSGGSSGRRRSGHS